MASGTLRSYWVGFLTGAGLSLFALYLLSQVVPITLEQWPRIAVGAVGLGLVVVGAVLQSWLRSSASPPDASP